MSSERVTFDDLKQLPYTRMVFEETMRLYPTVAQVSRQAIGEDEIGGVRVPKGAIINMNIWLVHRDPREWDDPEKFDPERFDPERVGDRSKLAYFPFGSGPRICIGNNFAMLESHLNLGHGRSPLAPAVARGPRSQGDREGRIAGERRSADVSRRPPEGVTLLAGRTGVQAEV